MVIILTNDEYHFKLSNAKTQIEREKINNEFLKSKVKSNKKRKHNQFFKTNVLVFIDLILSFIGILISLFK